MNIDHLIWNITTLFITGSIIEIYSRKLFIYFLLSSIFLTSLYIVITSPIAVSVMGYSNISAAGLCFACLIIYNEGIDRKDKWLKAGSVIGYLFFWSYELTLFELLTPWEYLTGSSITGTSGMTIKPGHIAGMIIGTLFGFILLYSHHIQRKQEHKKHCH
jgi:membrane associated rhomboid family serine protease